MKLHIIGICGTFMGGVARLAKESGHQVSGSDANAYPPMSTQLESLGVDLMEGYRAENIAADVDLVVVGNSISRGNPELESVLNKGLAYTSGAQWLSEHILANRWVVAIAGTHGKTTTSAMVAWILEHCGYEPGFLIGGVPANFGESARLGNSNFFVIEADEYDTSFADKRSKFIHYRPRTLVLNNLEFDHADIFANIGEIQKQFHHLVRTLPSTGLIIHNSHSAYLDETLEMGCWSEQQSFAANDNSDWSVRSHNPECSEFSVSFDGKEATVQWSLIGQHNMLNGLAAIAASHHVGVELQHAVEALGQFKSVKRRLETIYSDAHTIVYDDFAHHPTAIKGTIDALRAKVGTQRIIAVLEPRSNTMKQGVHKHLLADSLSGADTTYLYADAKVQWSIDELTGESTAVFSDTNALLDHLLDHALKPNNLNAEPTHILIMSNGGFEGLHLKLVNQLTSRKIT